MEKGQALATSEEYARYVVETFIDDEIVDIILGLGD